MNSNSKKIYMNNAATSWPKAPGVAKAVFDELEQPSVHSTRTTSKTKGILDECRETLAGMLDVDDPNCIVLTANATQSLNIAIYGLCRNGMKRVITTVMEHSSVIRPLYHRAESGGFEILIVGLDSGGAFDASQFDKLLESKPDLVAMCHASNVTGRINDIAPFFKKAKDAGAITLLDASQTLGHIPVHPKEMFADVVAFTGHKGLLGPAGTGGLYVSPEIELARIFVGGTGTCTEDRFHPEEMPIRLEAGTPNLPGFAGLLTSLKWMESDIEDFHETEKQNAKRMWDGIAEIPGVHVFDNNKVIDRMPLVSFRIGGVTVEDAGHILDSEYGIICRTGMHCAPLIHKAIGSSPEGTLRLSVSGFTTADEVEYVIDAVRRIASG
ncbi:aminotransferase class V-fold PLP-dependent enzyme [bacterium]|nr:aminotransferase class V-fold PLP-dependent enzyme [bacterium]